MIRKILITISVSCISVLCLYFIVSWIALTPLFDEIISETEREPRSELASNGIEYFRPCMRENSNGGSISWSCEDITRKLSLIWPGGGSMKVGLNNVSVDDGVVRKNYDVVEMICIFEDGRLKVDKVIVQP